MRMTRAALRAQEVEEELQAKIEDRLREQGLSSSQSDAIFEDADQAEDSSTTTATDAVDDPEAGRQALRDITQENYPVADATVEPEQEIRQAEEPATKSIKKAKGRKGRKVNDKTKGAAAVETSQNQTGSGAESLNHQESTQPDSQNNSSLVEIIHDSTNLVTDPGNFQGDSTEVDQIATNSDTGMMENTEPGYCVEQTIKSSDGETSIIESQSQASRPMTPVKPRDAIAKTPRFNPEIHLPQQNDTTSSADSTEDSFVDSIRSRSPSKLSQSVARPQVQESSRTTTSTPAKATPQKAFIQLSPQSSQRIEDSVEAIDALEDAIEKFAEDLPVIEALPFESPVRSRKTPIRTPATKSMQISTEPNTEKVERTPLRSAVKTSTTSTKLTSSASKARKSSIRVELHPTQTSSARAAAARRETVKDRVRAIESRPAPVAHRRVTSVNVKKREAPVVEQTVRPRHAATKSVPTVSPSSMHSMPSSNSPVVQTTEQPKKRVTSGGALSTSRPGFVPAKSNKPVTSSTFALPGEAIAAKLKAQREERLKREETQVGKKTTFKARPAPTRAARPSVMPRDNKASAARLGVRQPSGENKENMAPAKVTAVPTVRPGTTTAPTANTSVRRTTIAPKPSAVVESQKSNPSGPTDSDKSVRRLESLSAGQPSALTKTEAAQQKLRGREVYGRIKGSVQQQEEERKAKEAAARKARAEAAEKGRQASREWAEKQRKKVAGTTRPAVAETVAS